MPPAWQRWRRCRRACRPCGEAPPPPITGGAGGQRGGRQAGRCLSRRAVEPRPRAAADSAAGRSAVPAQLRQALPHSALHAQLLCRPAGGTRAIPKPSSSPLPAPPRPPCWAPCCASRYAALCARCCASPCRWHVGHLKPSYLSFLAHAALPANSGQCLMWHQIAALILPQLDASSRAILVSWAGPRLRRPVASCLCPAGRPSCLRVLHALLASVSPSQGKAWQAAMPSCPSAAQQRHPLRPPLRAPGDACSCRTCCRLYPPAGTSDASALLPPPCCCSHLQRRCWYQYSKALARIAVKTQRWMQRLQVRWRPAPPAVPDPPPWAALSHPCSSAPLPVAVAGAAA